LATDYVITQSACKPLSVAARGDLSIPYFLKERKLTYQTTLFLLLLLLFIMRSSDPYKATSPLDIELVIG